MNIMYKCCFCQKVYEWYDGLYENPRYNFDERRKAERQGKEYPEKSGVFISANAILLEQVIVNNDNIGVETLDDNMGVHINLCPDCMRKLLDSYRDESGNSAWDSV